MKIIEPKVIDMTPSNYSLESVYKHIEQCGRVCYKSENLITEDSYKKFYDNLKRLGHTSVFEHGTVYLKIDNTRDTFNEDMYINDFNHDPYSTVVINGNFAYITTNMRVMENHCMSALRWQCEPTEFHERRYTFKFICDRATSHQIVRHRKLSFSQESQRYINYSKGKYNKEITFVRPSWMDEKYLNWFKEDHAMTSEFAYDYTQREKEISATALWYIAMEEAEESYFELLDRGLKPQEARGVLPNATKTELVVTGFESDWKNFIELRDSEKAQADIRTLAKKVKEFISGK